MIAAVFDCVAYVQAVLSRQGPAYACLTLAEQKQFSRFVRPMMSPISLAGIHAGFQQRHAALAWNSTEKTG
jgi:hypothetical protein